MTHYRARNQAVGDRQPFRVQTAFDNYSDTLGSVSRWLTYFPELKVVPVSDAGMLLRIHLLDPRTNEVARVITIEEL